MQAYELRNIAFVSIREELVDKIATKALDSAERAAEKGALSTYLNLQANYTRPEERSSDIERREVIRRLRDQGFKVEEDYDGTVLSWEADI